MEAPEHRFQIERILGNGAYGTVVLARRPGEERRVVVKVLQPGLQHQQDILARARDEARLLQRLSHPNIVAFEGFTHYQGRPVVVIEYVDGIDLGRLVARSPGGLPAPVALELARQTAAALAAAWRAHKVVHRDIKPSNVLLSRTGDVKVVDFGLAYAEFDDREAHTDVLVLGSLGYMAPERADGLPASPAMDVCALGVTVFHLLTGRSLVLPKAGHRHDVVLERQLEHLPHDGGIRDLLREMCAFDPARRPTAEVVERRLGELVATLGPPDLARFAAEHVPTPARAEPPTRHAEWPNVAFLGDGWRDESPVERVSPLSALLRMLGISAR